MSLTAIARTPLSFRHCWAICFCEPLPSMDTIEFQRFRRVRKLGITWLRGIVICGYLFNIDLLRCDLRAVDAQWSPIFGSVMLIRITLAVDV